jgi:hypothetical protein
MVRCGPAAPLRLESRLLVGDVGENEDDRMGSETHRRDRDLCEGLG